MFSLKKEEHGNLDNFPKMEFNHVLNEEQNYNKNILSQIEVLNFIVFIYSFFFK